jgi:DNA-binding transcriptional MerR regulator
MYSTRAVIESLEVPERTLRHWSTTFSHHLSTGARPPRGERGGGHRRYNDTDLAVLKRVKTLAGSGLRLAEVDAVLRGDRKPTTLGATRRGKAARPGSSELIEQLAAASQQQRELMSSLGEQVTRRIEELTARVAYLEGRLMAAERRAAAAPPPEAAEETAEPAAAGGRRGFLWFHGKPAPPRRSAEALRRNTIRLMARRGWTPEDLAFYASLPIDTVSKLVTGPSGGGQVPENVVRAIAQALEVDAAVLFEPSA